MEVKIKKKTFYYIFFGFIIFGLLIAMMSFSSVDTSTQGSEDTIIKDKVPQKNIESDSNIDLSSGNMTVYGEFPELVEDLVTWFPLIIIVIIVLIILNSSFMDL